MKKQLTVESKYFMTSKQHTSLLKPKSLEQLWKGKLKQGIKYGDLLPSIIQYIWKKTTEGWSKKESQFVYLPLNMVG